MSCVRVFRSMVLIACAAATLAISQPHAAQAAAGNCALTCPPSVECGEGTYRTDDGVCLPKECNVTTNARCTVVEAAAKVCPDDNCEVVDRSNPVCPEGFTLGAGGCTKSVCKSPDAATQTDRRNGICHEVKFALADCPFGYRKVGPLGVRCNNRIEIGRSSECGRGATKKTLYNVEAPDQPGFSYCDRPLRIKCPAGYRLDADHSGVEKCVRQAYDPCELAGSLYEYNRASGRCEVAVEALLQGSCQNGRCAEGTWRCPRAIGLDGRPRPSALSRIPKSGVKIDKCLQSFQPRCPEGFSFDAGAGTCAERVEGSCGTCAQGEACQIIYAAEKGKDGKLGPSRCYPDIDRGHKCLSTSIQRSTRYVVYEAGRNRPTIKTTLKKVKLKVQRRHCTVSLEFFRCPSGWALVKGDETDYCYKENSKLETDVTLTSGDACPAGTRYSAAEKACFTVSSRAPTQCPAAAAGEPQWVAHASIASICTRERETSCPAEVTTTKVCRIIQKSKS